MKARDLLTARARRTLPASRQFDAWLGAHGLTRRAFSERLATAETSPITIYTSLSRLLDGRRPEPTLRERIEAETGIPAGKWGDVERPTCSGPSCNRRGSAPHPCPYRSDVKNDHETLCNCCKICANECLRSI